MFSILIIYILLFLLINDYFITLRYYYVHNVYLRFYFLPILYIKIQIMQYIMFNYKFELVNNIIELYY